jgi:hypothetical protein
MSYYTKYIKPVIENLPTSLFESEYGKSSPLVQTMKNDINHIKKPWFELKSQKEKNAAIVNFYYTLVKFYQYNLQLSNHETLHSLAEQKVQLESHTSLPKKYRGILETHPNPIGTSIKINKSNQHDNASSLWLVPAKGIRPSQIKELIGDIMSQNTTQNLDKTFTRIKKLSDMMRPRNANAFDNTPRQGAAHLEQELVTNIKKSGRFLRASQEFKSSASWQKHVAQLRTGEIQQLTEEIQQTEAKLNSSLPNLDIKSDTALAELLAQLTALQQAKARLAQAQQELATTQEKIKHEQKLKLGLIKQKLNNQQQI